MENKKDFLQETKNIVDKNKRDILLATTKSSVNGAIAGLVIGLMVGHYKNKNMYLSGLIGAVIGASVTGFLTSKE